MQKIAIDFGNSNTKIAYRDETGEINTFVIKSQATRNGLGSENVVTYDNCSVMFGVGEQLTEQDKTKRKYIEHSILLAAKMCGITSGKVELAVGLPLSLYKTGLKELYQANMSKIKGLKGEVDGTAVNITVDTVKVFGEGFSAFVACSRDVSVAPSTIIDIGYKTTDVVALSKSNGKWKIDSYCTVNKGMLDVYKDMSHALLGKGIVLKEEEIESRLENNPVILTENENENLEEYLVFSNDTVASIYNQIKLSIADISNRMNYLVGGGANAIIELLPTKNKQVIGDKEKCIYANVLGYLFQAEK